jgi:hypothetical protein
MTNERIDETVWPEGGTGSAGFHKHSNKKSQAYIFEVHQAVEDG